jgi:hypothetical protein
VTANPVEFWRELYPFEEPIGDEIETLKLLRARLDHKAQIAAHIGSIETELLKLPGELQAKYGWCRIPDNFTHPKPTISFVRCASSPTSGARPFASGSLR